MSEASEVDFRATKGLHHPATLTGVALLFMTFSGWMADTLKGDCIKLGFRDCANLTSLDWPGFFFSLFGFIVSAVLLYVTGREYLSVRQLAKKSVSAHKALVMTLSTLPPKTTIDPNGERICKEERAVSISGDIDKDIDALNPLKVNTQQFLRAVRPHLRTIERIVLLGSINGSDTIRSRYANLLRCYKPDLEVDIASPAVNFEDLDEMQTRIGAICDELKRRHGYAEGDIMIDVTGGNKTASISAVFATLERPQLEFQYVQTEAPYSVLSFNVVSQSRFKPNA